MKPFRNYFLLLQLLWLPTITIHSACKKNPDPVIPPPDTIAIPYAWEDFVMGADLSFVNQIQDKGGVYRDSGVVQDPFLIFKNHGANLVRVRLWHHPQWIADINGGTYYSDLADVEKTIQRAKSAGMAVNLDLHYSDRWADPAHQDTPAAWAGLSLEPLKDSVYNYTLAVLNYLKSKNLTPEMIQIGNETNQGMLWPVGKVVNNDFTNFAALLQSGIQAVRDFSATSDIKPRIMLHVAQFQNAEYYFSNLIINEGVTDFDVLGISHYYNWSTVSSMAQITSTIKSLKDTYNREVMIAENAFPWTTQNADNYGNIISGSNPPAGYEVSKEGQLKYMKDLVQAVIDGGGSGIMYWEPAWITSSMFDSFGTGSGWDNCAYFDFGGNALPVFDFMTFKYKF